MATQASVLNDRSADGMAMSCLSDQHWRFVIELMDLGLSKNAASKAARAAGYTLRHGYKLMRDARILAAIREETGRRIRIPGALSINVIIDIAQDKTHKDSYRAAKYLLRLNGFSPKRRIVVKPEPRDIRAIIRDTKARANELGLDPDQFIAMLGFTDLDAIDAECTDVGSRPPLEN